MNCFVDTSAFYAILDRDDAHHAAARSQWESLLAGEQTQLVTSNYVVVETTALVQHRLGLKAAGVFHNDVLPVVRVEWIDRTQHEAAIMALLGLAQRPLSLVDLVSFGLMRQRGIGQAFAFDTHFADQGFTVLPRKG